VGRAEIRSIVTNGPQFLHATARSGQLGSRRCRGVAVVGATGALVLTCSPARVGIEPLHLGRRQRGLFAQSLERSRVPGLFATDGLGATRYRSFPLFGDPPRRASLLRRGARLIHVSPCPVALTGNSSNGRLQLCGCPGKTLALGTEPADLRFDLQL